MIIKLVRLLHLQDRILGTLIAKNKIFATLELPWKDNAKNISCIPKGSYTLVRHWSRKFPYIHLQLLDVPNRSGILIHAGNTPKDTSGCILLAKNFAENNDLTATSRDAVDELMQLLDNKENLTLEVIDVQG